MKITGSTQNELFYDYLRFGTEIQNQIKLSESSLPHPFVNDSLRRHLRFADSLNALLKDYRAKLFQRYPGNYVARLLYAITPITDSVSDFSSYWSNLDVSDERFLRSPVYHKRLSGYFLAFVADNPDSIEAITAQLVRLANGNKTMTDYTVRWIVNYYAGSHVTGADSLVSRLMDKYNLVQIIKPRTEPRLPYLLKAQVRDVELFDTLSNSVSLYGIKASYVVLFFWDTRDSKRELAELNRLYKQTLKSNDVEVVAFYTGSNRSEWIDAIKQFDFTWTNVWDPENKTKYRISFDVYKTPLVYLLDSEHRVVAKRIKVLELQEIIEKLLKRDARHSK